MLILKNIYHYASGKIKYKMKNRVAIQTQVLVDYLLKAISAYHSSPNKFVQFVSISSFWHHSY